MKGRAVKKRIGRPPLPKNEVLRVFSLRLRSAERAAMKKAAGAVPLTTWVRRVLVKAARGRKGAK